jgi:hypothetical protein
VGSRDFRSKYSVNLFFLKILTDKTCRACRLWSDL